MSSPFEPEAIDTGIGDRASVELVEVGAAPAELAADIGLLVVGGPTHLHGMSSAKSRVSAATRVSEPIVSTRIGMREWLEALPAAPRGIIGAAFDTHTNGPELLTGSAAKGAARTLKAKGYRVVEAPASFVLAGPAEPVVDRIPADELERARAWGRTLGASIAEPATVR